MVLSLRAKITGFALGFVALVALLGWFALNQTAQLGALAFDIYDHTVTGITFANQAQTALLRYELEKHDAADDRARSVLQGIADKIDLAGQRTTTPRTRDAAHDAQAAVTALIGGGTNTAAANKALSRLVGRFAADGQDVRDNAATLVTSSARALWFSAGAAALAASLCGFLLMRAVVPRVRRALAVANAIAEGRLDNDIQARGGDEAAQLLGALARMQAAIAANLAEIERQRAADQVAAEAAQRRATLLGDTTQRFEGQVQAALDSLTQAASGLRHASHRMSDAAASTSDRSGTVAAAAGETASVVNTVAAATEELAASIREVGGRVDQATEIVANAVSQADRTDATVRGLSAAAEKIGAIVDTIRGIAEQTNLLALNATIEAARAGEAGRGFAVVAGEVKALASQTARATAEIAEQIRTMQAETSSAVEAIRGIAVTINDMNSLTVAIATAMDQQGQATADIARNIATAAAGTGEVSGNIGSVTDAAQDMRGTADDVLGAATALSDQSSQLDSAVRGFLGELRAAA